jgi:hypothetical protein
MKHILILTLIACIYGSTISEIVNSDHPFGKSVGSLVEVNMKTGGSLNELK